MAAGDVGRRKLRLVVQAFLPLLARGVPRRTPARVRALVREVEIERGIGRRRRRIPFGAKGKIARDASRRPGRAAALPIKLCPGVTGLDQPLAGDGRGNFHISDRVVRVDEDGNT